MVSPLPPMAPELVEMLAKMHARERRTRDQRRAEFAAQQEPEIPDLEFLTPECSVCGLSTDSDGDSFCCVECRITWGRSGEDPERWDGS
jgi:hypothetical protein